LEGPRKVERMAFSESESQEVVRSLTSFMERKRPPASVRHELDLMYRIERQSVLLFEVRPAWRGPPGAKIELPIAKATYVRAHDHWRVFWQRADLKWHRYEPAAEVISIDEFLGLVEEDEYACFFG
jgi:hypothetical protein